MLVGAEPKVAMLSYSSMGSAKHDDVTKVADAVKIAHGSSGTETGWRASA